MNVILPISTNVVHGPDATQPVGDAQSVVEAFKAQASESAHVTSVGGLEDNGIMQAVKNYVDSSDPNRVKLNAITKVASSGDPSALTEYSIMTKERTNKAAFFKIVSDALVNTIKTLGQS